MKDLPRYPLAQLPTPITDAVRLREALGGPSKCPRILIKRDDLTGLGLGGNKARKLEYLIADALAKGAHTVITTGAVQSNHARMTAAAACIAGLRCVLVLTSRHAVPPIEGNLLLDRLFGAEVRFVPAEDPMLAVGRDEEVVADVAREETAAGRIPYVIPVGGSSPVGALGYVSGTDELVRQLEGDGGLAVTPVLRQRLARHASRPDARGKAESSVVRAVGRGRQRRRSPRRSSGR